TTGSRQISHAGSACCPHSSMDVQPNPTLRQEAGTASDAAVPACAAVFSAAWISLALQTAPHSSSFRMPVRGTNFSDREKVAFHPPDRRNNGLRDFAVLFPSKTAPENPASMHGTDAPFAIFLAAMRSGWPAHSPAEREDFRLPAPTNRTVPCIRF